MTDADRLLVGVVLPIGTAIWAFTQAPGGPSWTTWLLIGVAVAGLFVGFNRLLVLADERLNPEVNRDEVIS